MNDIQQLREEIEKIKVRNARVEADKAWEVSWTRRTLIVILTYLVVAGIFYIAKLPDPFVNAIIPTVAFLLSTISIPVSQKFWIRYIYKK